MELLKIAVIGCGRWGINHVRVLSKVREEYNLEVIAVDVNPQALDTAKKRYRVERVYRDYMEMIKTEKPDACVISVPTKMHFRVLKDVIPYSDVLIEKPMTTNVRDALEVVKLAQKNGRIVMVGHIERFNPAVAFAKTHIEKRVKAGDNILFVKAERVGVRIPGYEKYGGVGLDLMVHDVDVACFLLKKLPDSVQAVAYGSGEVEEELHAMYTLGDTLAVFCASVRALMKRRSLHVQFEKACLELDYMLQRVTITEGVHTDKIPEDYLGFIAMYQSASIEEHRLMRGEENEPLLLEDKHFIQCLRNNKKPLVNEVDGYIAVKLVEVALKAAEKGEKITIKWDEDFIHQ